uniref:Uncharacterized protein n=1 Tax=Acrobeloides nanus TaxID=290746 RepID=A0A914EI03_9BILA
MLQKIFNKFAQALELNRAQILRVQQFMTVMQEKLVMDDYSLGMEEIPIPVINEVDDEVIPMIDYRPTTFTDLLSVAYELKKSREFCEGCSCEDNCIEPEKCECQLRTLTNTNNKSAISGYKNNLLLEKIFTGIYECNKNCKCKKLCPNRVTQQGIKVPLQIFKTFEAGWGARALCDIPKGTFISTYTGRMITNEHFSGLPKLLQRIRSNPEDVKQSLRYVAFLGDLVKNSKIPVSPIFYVDASTSGNIGRIFNHSCDPNMFAQYVFVDTHDIRLPNLVFFAKRHIPSGEELCWDYGYKPGNPNMNTECKCGSTKCRGKLF